METSISVVENAHANAIYSVLLLLDEWPFKHYSLSRKLFRRVLCPYPHSVFRLVTGADAWNASLLVRRTA